MARSEKCVGNCLRFDALRSVDNEQRAFARGERARNLVRKIDVARRVDQIQAIGVAIFGLVMEANAFRLDGDAAFAFQVHGIENLRRHFALREAARHLNQTIGKCGLAVIDMRDDAEISLEPWVHVPVLPAGAEGRKPPARDFLADPRREHRMTAQNRCLRTTSLPQIADGVSRTAGPQPTSDECSQRRN